MSYKTNKELLNILETAVENYPSVSFSQILNGLGFVQPGTVTVGEQQIEIWANERKVKSEVVLKRVKNAMSLLNIKVNGEYL